MTNKTLDDQLRRLAEFAPCAWPVVSLYLSAQPNERGQAQFAPWLRKELSGLRRTFPPNSENSKSFEQDVQRIETWLAEQLQPATHGVALFACAYADGFFEAIQLNAPITKNELHVQDQPHLYPLARLIDQYPRYAAVTADTNAARIVVFGLNRPQGAAEVENVKTRRSSAGGWSQARFQRHVENFHKQHAKEVVDVLDRIVREEGLKHVVLAGDEHVVIPMLKAEMPKDLSAIVVDTKRLDPDAPDHVLLSKTMEALREADAQRDADKVDYLVNELRAGGLAVAGVVNTFTALEKGQVDELLLAASRAALETPEEALAVTAETLGASGADVDRAALISDALVTAAQQTSAKITFIENSDALTSLGGCGALLRYKE